MSSDELTGDESRKFAVLVARVWSDSNLAKDYERDPRAVLSGAGISLGSRAVPEIPSKPAELSAQSLARAASGSSASSLSCATCPCSGCTASCACCNEEKAVVDMKPHLDAMMKLADNPAGREQARKTLASWNVNVTIAP